MLQQLITNKLEITFVWGQFVIGTGVAFLLLAVAVLVPLRRRVLCWLAGIASLVVLLQVLCMRWNVVIGGQLLSKSGEGFQQYHMEWGGREGILAAIATCAAPFVLLYILYRILPPYVQEAKPTTGGEDTPTEPNMAAAEG